MRLYLFALILLLSTTAIPTGLTADEGKARYAAPSAETLEDVLRVTPLELSGGSQLTLISPEHWAPLLKKLGTFLGALHDDFSDVFGEIPPLKSTVRLMDEQDFFRATGAPSWTNAMYYKGQIIIPLPQNTAVDFDNIIRSIKHEYAHAVINALSAGRCPGWLDEGLAQWAEGEANPALKPALQQWLRRNAPVPLSLLQGGFTRLDPEIVPAAYAQSLYAANTVINTWGFREIRNYFDELRSGEEKPRAFEKSFDLSTMAFELRLSESLIRWMKKDQQSPRIIRSGHQH